VTCIHAVRNTQSKPGEPRVDALHDSRCTDFGSVGRKCSRRTNPTDRWAVRSGDFNTFDSNETLEECRAGTPGSIISGSDEKSKLPAAYVAPPFGDGDLERRVRFDIAAAWRHERSTHRVFVGRQVDRLRLEHRIVRASRWPSLRRQQHPGVAVPHAELGSSGSL
jgi:hypothetical protein